MNALVRVSDRAILAVDQITGWNGDTPIVESVTEQEGATLVALTNQAYLHWWSIDHSHGDTMALWEDGTIGVLVYAPPSAEQAAVRAELNALAATSPALAKALAAQFGLEGVAHVHS